MRKIIFCALWLLIVVSTQAQSNADFDKVTLATAELTAQYNLNQAQQLEVKKVMETSQRNLAEIAPYQTSNPSVYLAKKRAIREYVEGKLKLILKDTQLSILEKKQADRHLAERQLRKQMKGATSAEVELALLEMEK